MVKEKRHMKSQREEELYFVSFHRPFSFSVSLFYLFIFLAVLGFELRALSLFDRYSTT
jgi:hypothetical protein